MGLLDLPSELLAQVFLHLDDGDVFAARYSSRAVDKASFAHFGKRFFRKKGFLITSLSLHVLQNIADHEELRKYVQHVWFNPDCYTFARPACAAAGEDEDLDEADELMTPVDRKHSPAADQRKAVLDRQYDAYRECMRDHTALMRAPRLAQKLSAAFALLPNLKTVGMRRSEDYGPYGWSIFRDAIGEDPRALGAIPTKPAFDLSGPTSLLIDIIHAVAKTGVHLRRLYTDAVEIDNIDERILSPSLLREACNSLWYVELNATKGWLVKHDHKPPPAERNFTTLHSPDDYGAGLSRLLASMPALKEIGLQIFPDRRRSHQAVPIAHSSDSWRQSYSYLTFARIALEVPCPNLTRVKLENITTTSAIICQFLHSCSHRLTSLKLRDIRLLSLEDETRPWETFFVFLSTHCPELDYVIFRHLLYDGGGISFVPDLSRRLPVEGQDISYMSFSMTLHVLFANRDEVTFEVRGREEVKGALKGLVARHWYQPLHNKELWCTDTSEEEVWHTDTSDEEW